MSLLHICGKAGMFNPHREVVNKVYVHLRESVY